MEDVIDLTLVEEASARVEPVEPIGVNVCADLIDLCESEDEGRQEHQQTLPQHFDWNYIAERRAAYLAVQSLSALTRPEPAGVIRPTRRNDDKREKVKGNRMLAASQTPEEKSPQRKKKRRKSQKREDRRTEDDILRNPTSNNDSKKKKMNKRKITDENPLRRKKKRKRVPGGAKREELANAPSSAESVITTPNNGRSHYTKPEGVLSQAGRNRLKRQRRKQRKLTRMAQNNGTSEALKRKPPLSHHQLKPENRKANASEEKLAQHVASLPENANQGQNRKPNSCVQLELLSQYHGVNLCQSIGDTDRTSLEHDPDPVDRITKFENHPDVYPNDQRQKVQHQSGEQQNQVLDQEDKAPSSSLSSLNRVEATGILEADNRGLECKEEQRGGAQDKLKEQDPALADTDDRKKHPLVRVDSSTQNCRMRASFKVKHKNETSSAEPASIPSVPAAPNDRRQKVQHQSGEQQIGVLAQDDKVTSTWNHVKATDSVENKRAYLGCKEEQEVDAQDTLGEHEASISETDPDLVVREMKFENKPDMYVNNSSQNCRTPASFEEEDENETSFALPTIIPSLSASRNDRQQKLQHQSGTQNDKVVDQEEKEFSSSSNIEATDSLEPDGANSGCKDEQPDDTQVAMKECDPLIPDADDRESSLLQQSHVHAESSTHEGGVPPCCTANESEVPSVKGMSPVSVVPYEERQKAENQTEAELGKGAQEDASFDNEADNSTHVGRTCQETKEQPRVDDHVTLTEMRNYWDSGEDSVLSDQLRSKVSESKDQHTPAVNIRTDPGSRTQGTPHASRDSSPDSYVYNVGTVIFTNLTQVNVKAAEKAEKANEANVIDLSGEASLDRRDGSRDRSKERMVFSKAESVPDSGHHSSLRDLIRNNGGKEFSAKVKKSTPPPFDGESWQSTVIIVDSSEDEGILEYDESNSKGTGRASAATGNGSSDKNSSSHERFWEASTTNRHWPRSHRRPATRKYTKRRATSKSNAQYNFTFSETEAHREQERLLREAAERVRLGLAMNVSHLAPFVADTNVPDISKLNQDHWKSPDPYTRLGLPRGASINVIKSRYRRLALKYHPDKSNFVHTTARFQAVTEAYKLLTGMG